MTNPEKFPPKSPSYTSPKPVTAPTKVSAKPKSNNPSMSKALMEVLQKNKGGKGMSLKAIKNGVLDLHPGMQETFSNLRLHKAISKGLDEGSVIRPKNSEDTGFKGKFLLSKEFINTKEKEAKQKLKEKEKKKKDAEAGKKASKPRAKSPATLKSKPKGTKSPLKAKSPKNKIPKASAPKSPKSPGANAKKLKATPDGKKAKSPSGKTLKAKSPKERAPAMKAVTKTKSAARKTPTTPKVSKSATAGAKIKTASAKKLKAKK